MDLELQNHNQENNNTKNDNDNNNNNDTPPKLSKSLKRVLIILNCIFIALGNTGGPLLLRLYFHKGGKRLWLSSWIETGGWPIIFLPLLASYLHRRQNNYTSHKFFFITPKLIMYCAVLGFLTGLDDFLYAYGFSFLPVSTAAILVSTHLAFTALFAFLIVKQKFTAYSLNAVGLLTVGALILGLHGSSDRPENVSKKQYYLGFVMTLSAAALYGLVLPLIELMYSRAKQAITYTLVMEMQLVMGFFATAFCTVGMVAHKDFQGIPNEAKQYELGEVGYYSVLVWDAIFWQCFFIGTVGVIFCVNTLLAAVLIAVFIPVTEILAVIFLREKFTSQKAVSLVLALWGLASYIYGEYKLDRKKKKQAVVNQVA